MSNANERIEAFVANTMPNSPWSVALLLYRNDPEAFFIAGCEGVSDGVSTQTKSVVQVISQIRLLLDGFTSDSSNTGTSFRLNNGTTVFVPQEYVKDVEALLHELAGASIGGSGGKDYLGNSASEAEIRFKLGNEEVWPSDFETDKARCEKRPTVLQISNEEIVHLASQPAYITYQLMNCARRVVLRPVNVFRGLKRDNPKSAKVNDGWAFCGHPRFTFDNQGNKLPPPSGKVFVVYANEDGFVFDWDWVESCPHDEESPVDSQLRFENPIEANIEASLLLPESLSPGVFDSQVACYSSLGDCIFCYLSDAPSYAQRVNADLTIFKSFANGNVTGFKVKNLERILQFDKSIVISDSPDIVVSVASALLATLKHYPDTAVRIYSVLIEALHKNTPKAPNVTLPRPLRQLATA